MKKTPFSTINTFLARNKLIVWALVAGAFAFAGDYATKRAKEEIDRLPVSTTGSVLTAQVKAIPKSDLAEVKRISAIFAEVTQATEQRLGQKEAVSTFTVKVPVKEEVKPGAEKAIVKVPEIDLATLARVVTLTATSPGGASINGGYVEVGQPLDFLPAMTTGGKRRFAILDKATQGGIVLRDPVENKRISISGGF